jgi:hypothetical protein
MGKKSKEELTLRKNYEYVKFFQLAGDSRQVKKGIERVTESPTKGRVDGTTDMSRKRLIPVIRI